MTDPSALRLVVAARANALPVRMPGALTAAVAGEALHLFSGEPRGTSVHLALDPAGQPLGPAVDTGLPPAFDAVGHRGHLLVSCVGERAGHGVPVLALVGVDGAVRDRHDLPAPDGVAQWPRLATAGGSAHAVWATGDPARYQTATIGAAAPATDTLDLAAERIVDLAVAASGTQLLLASLLAEPDRLVLRVLAGNRVVKTREVAGDPAFVRVRAAPHGWWLLAKWRGRGVLTLRPLDAALDDIGPAVQVDPRATPTEQIWDAWLVTGATTAVVVRLAVPSGHRQRLREVVAPVADDGAPGEFVELTEAGSGYSAAGWLGDRLVLVHGESQPLVTVLEGS